MDGERNGHRVGAADQRPCWLDVDLDAVAANVRALRELVGPSTRVCAIVKADAYGLGAQEVGRAALAAGAQWLAVARVDEGARLRVGGMTAPILLLTGFASGEADAIVRHGLTPTVVQTDDALALARAAGRAGAQLAVHLKVDTGLTRYGAAPSAAPHLARLVETLPSLRLEGLYTHFASADEVDLSFTRTQLARLLEVRAALAAEGIHPSIVHGANSAGALGEPAARLDMVRVGITLSGHVPGDATRPASLRPAVSLRARLARVYDLTPGTTVGYGRTHRVEHATRAGLVLAGYADGVPRAHAGRGWSLVGDQQAPLIGRVSMDQCVVDLTANQTAAVGDEVVLFGEAGAHGISLDQFAAWSDTIAHEALCRVGSRVPRRYRAGGRSWWGDSETALAAAVTPVARAEAGNLGRT